MASSGIILVTPAYPTATPASVMTRVRAQLIDLGSTQRWTDTELLGWVSDAERQIIAANPTASQSTALMQMSQGTRQQIPVDGFMYLDAHRNMGVGGATPGSALIQVPRKHMDTQYPTWHSAAQVAAPQVKVFDPAEPTIFYVYPPSDGTGMLEIAYSVGAIDLTSTTSTLVVRQIFETAIYYYVMWMACLKDSDYAPGQAAANQYLTAFEGFMAAYTKDPNAMAAQAGDS